MTGPTFAPVDADTGDLLDLIADDQRKADDYSRFLLACRADWEQHGHVSTNCVRRSMSNKYGLVIEPHTYSSFWRAASQKDGPLRVVPDQWETCSGSTSGNNGKQQPVRRWVG